VQDLPGYFFNREIGNVHRFPLLPVHEAVYVIDFRGDGSLVDIILVGIHSQIGHPRFPDPQETLYIDPEPDNPVRGQPQQLAGGIHSGHKGHIRRPNSLEGKIKTGRTLGGTGNTGKNDIGLVQLMYPLAVIVRQYVIESGHAVVMVALQVVEQSGNFARRFFETAVKRGDHGP
jgi:hypothetical protein